MASKIPMLSLSREEIIVEATTAGITIVATEVAEDVATTTETSSRCPIRRAPLRRVPPPTPLRCHSRVATTTEVTTVEATGEAARTEEGTAVEEAATISSNSSSNQSRRVDRIPSTETKTMHPLRES